MISISIHSGIYNLTTQQFIKSDINTAWQFFSSPENLSKITPKKMGFHITSPPSKKMYRGQIITYKINVFPGIATNWVTEITQVKTRKFFVDEQRFGPYTMWHHEHHFQAVEGGILMTDIVHYKLPFGFVGRLFHPIIVKPQLHSIFSSRKNVLDAIFNHIPQNKTPIAVG